MNCCLWGIFEFYAHCQALSRPQGLNPLVLGLAHVFTPRVILHLGSADGPTRDTPVRRGTPKSNQPGPSRISD